MMRGRGLTILAVAFAAGAGCQSPAAVGLNASDEAALREALDLEMKAANAADAARWASVYTQDAIVLRPHAPAVEGRDAIQSGLRHFLPSRMRKARSGRCLATATLRTPVVPTA